MQVTHIGPEDVEKMNMLFPKGQQQSDGGVVKDYVDPLQRYKPVERVHVQHDDINDRLTLQS